MKWALIAAAFGGSMFYGAVASASLVHRYSFNDGTANDSVGSVNGTINGGAVIAGGQLTTTGANNTDYVLLPSSVTSGITGDFTIEQFVTIPTNPGNFSSLFSLSTSNRNFLLLNPSRPNSNGVISANFQQSTGSDIEKDIQAATGFPFGTTEHDVALTYVAASNIATVYLDGASVASGSIASAVNTGTNFSLEAATAGGFAGINGNGPFGDSSLNGSTDEFRIYNNALSATAAAASFAAGPNSVPEPASLGLLGLLGLATFRRQRRASR